MGTDRLLISSTQVLRYSALGAGIFYGLYHQAALSTQTKLAQTQREYEHKQKLIAQAKAEYAKKNAPKSSKTESGGGMFTLSDWIYCYRTLHIFPLGDVGR